MPLITGNIGANNLHGTDGHDTLAGYAGDDWLNGGRGRDLLIGSHGADTFIWDEDRNASGPTLDIYSGGDTRENYDPNPYGELSGGDKLILGASLGAGGFQVYFTNTESGAAIDAFGNRVNFSGMERLETGAGNDYINGHAATVLAARDLGGAGSDVPVHGLTVLAGGGNDTLIGSRVADVLDGGEGNDSVYGGAGDDLLMSSAGDDYGDSGAGNDNVRWGNNGGTAPIYDIGNDTLVGGEGFDLLNLWGKEGGDNSVGTVVRFFSNSSGMATYAQDNGTVVFREFEQFWTHEGSDTITAAGANVDVNAEGINFNSRWGSDILTGSNGRDTLEGGDHADTINGGRGDDIISMFDQAYHADGSGVAPDAYRDVLVLADDFGTDRVRAFQVGNADGRLGDRLNVANLHDGYGNRVDVDDVVVGSQGNNAMLIFPNGERLVLEGVSPATLTRAALIEMGIPSSSAQINVQAVRSADASASAAYDEVQLATVSAEAGAAKSSGSALRDYLDADSAYRESSDYAVSHDGHMDLLLG